MASVGWTIRDGSGAGPHAAPLPSLIRVSHSQSAGQRSLQCASPAAAVLNLTKHFSVGRSHVPVFQQFVVFARDSCVAGIAAPATHARLARRDHESWQRDEEREPRELLARRPPATTTTRALATAPRKREHSIPASGGSVDA